MKSRKYLSLELFVLFIIIPLSLSISIPVWLKSVLLVLGFMYAIIIMLREEKGSFKIQRNLEWKPFWKRTLILFVAISVITSLYVFFMEANKLFCVPINKPKLWIIILLVYTFLSVWPQEIIYRTFFFTRYERLFYNKKILVFVNAIIFSMAHLFFRNTLVIVLTFVGGLLFGMTYLKTKSTLLVSIEHAIYGNWLFTVGMGQMLAFPGMESC